MRRLAELHRACDRGHLKSSARHRLLDSGLCYGRRPRLDPRVWQRILWPPAVRIGEIGGAGDAEASWLHRMPRLFFAQAQEAERAHRVGHRSVGSRGAGVVVLAMFGALQFFQLK